MIKNCGECFPDDRAKFESALASWERSESGIVKIIQAFVEEEVLADPEKAKLIDHIKSSLKQNLDAVLNMPAEKSAVDEVFLLYCEKHFSELESGVRRSRTPRMYEFLDRALEQRK